MTGYEGLQHRVVIARFDPATGQLALDTRFREDGASEPGFRMDNKTWPHGGDAKGIPHGAVFSRPASAGRHLAAAARARPSRRRLLQPTS